MAGNNKKTLKEKSSSQAKKTNGLTIVDLEKFRAQLLNKRREIVGDVNEMESETLKQSRTDANGDLSCMPIHMADRGTDTFEQEFAINLMDGEMKILKEVDDALKRIADGTYGICEGSGNSIPKARLKAKPWARYCLEYARKAENGEVPNQ